MENEVTDQLAERTDTRSEFRNHLSSNRKARELRTALVLSMSKLTSAHINTELLIITSS